jgi:hypothetical protein
MSEERYEKLRVGSQRRVIITPAVLDKFCPEALEGDIVLVKIVMGDVKPKGGG